jgi:N-acetylmuramoyl-L-alanine amidase
MILVKGKLPQICIDPALGGQETGQYISDSLTESKINLLIAKELTYQLDLLDISSFLTREEDTYVSQSDRLEKAKNATCFLSIQCNNSRSRAEGIETIYGAPGGLNKSLANYVQSAMIKNCSNHRDRGIKMSPSKEFPECIYVLRLSHCPSAIIKCEFLSNPNHLMWLCNPDTHRSIAYSLGQGIQNFLMALPRSSKVEKSKMDSMLKRDIDNPISLNISQLNRPQLAFS